MSKKEKIKVSSCQMDEFLTDNNISIVDSFRKRCLCKDKDEWEQLRTTIIWKAVRDYKEGYDTKFESYLFTKSKFEVMKFNTSYKKDLNRIDRFPILIEPSYNETIKNNLLDNVNSLPEKYRKVIVYKYFDGYSIREICRLMEITNKQCKNLIFEALNILRLVC